MAVAQLVSLFEALDHRASIKSVPSSFRSQSSSSRVRLSLQTIFSHNPLHRSPKSTKNMSSTPSSTISSSPSSSFSSFRGKSRTGIQDTRSTLSPAITSAHNHIRRQPSAIDLALEEEQMADHAETIGLGFLEPRPRANTGSSSSSTQMSHCSMMEFMNESVQTPVVLDGIFEVMERA